MSYKEYASTEEMKYDMIEGYEIEIRHIENADFQTEEEKQRLEWLKNEIKRLKLL